jgi:hypothetical protein
LPAVELPRHDTVPLYDRPAQYPTPSVRHLCYHIYPVKGSVWRHRVEQLKRRFGLFNGKRSIAIVVDSSTDSAEDVQTCFKGLKCAFGVFDNDPSLREVKTYEWLFEQLLGDVGPEHATLYGHAKGVHHATDFIAQHWADVLEEVCLDYWPLVAQQLSAYTATGCMKQFDYGPHHGPDHRIWHYSGSWFWFRNDKVLTRPNWRDIPRTWTGIELWPSIHIDRNEGACLWLQSNWREMHPYVPQWWNQSGNPALERFRAKYAGNRTPYLPAKRLEDWLPGWAVIDSGSDPVRWWCIDGFGSSIDMKRLPASRSKAWEAHYDNDCERGKRTMRHVPKDLDGVFRELQSDEALATWSSVVGYSLERDVSLHGGGLQVTRPGGWLNTHLDYDLHPHQVGRRRALNLIAFLNPTWSEEQGGALVLTDPVGKVVKRFAARPSRLVAFECGELAYHGVEVVGGKTPRVTAAVSLLAVADGKETRKRALFMPRRA